MRGEVISTDPPGHPAQALSPQRHSSFIQECPTGGSEPHALPPPPNSRLQDLENQYKEKGKADLLLGSGWVRGWQGHVGKGEGLGGMGCRPAGGGGPDSTSA